MKKNSYQGNKGMDDTEDFDNIHDSSRVGLVKGISTNRGNNFYFKLF